MCGDRGHTIAECKKITGTTMKELVSLGWITLRNRLNIIKKNKTATQEDTQHVVHKEVTVQEDDMPDVNDDKYVPEPGLPSLYEMHNMSGMTHTSVTMQFLMITFTILTQKESQNKRRSCN